MIYATPFYKKPSIIKTDRVLILVEEVVYTRVIFFY